MWLDYRLILFGTPGAWLLPVLLLVSMLATEEALSLLRAKQHRPIAWAAYVGNLLIPLTAAWPIIVALTHWQPAASPGWPLAAVAIPLLLILIAEMRRFPHAGGAVVSAALAIFVVIYIGVLISFWALLRLHFSNARGM